MKENYFWGGNPAIREHFLHQLLDNIFWVKLEGALLHNQTEVDTSKKSYD